ncbi:PAS domain-containing sensor histidine kinase [Nocardioides houyundeii]|uniref:PAS domain-containing sensor histidine kinase n=1 Tax=Nocardioides houyundeii TaxID=2045452 RepID=UPI000DF1B02A|nr:HAMP domain-containing sensor histidine kinase [Nocardioides houyundeii]
MTPLGPASVLAVSTDAQGLVTWCNAAVEALVGRPTSALEGRSFPREILDRDQLEQRSAAAGVPCGPELFLVDPARFERRRGPELRLGALDRRRPGRSDGTEQASDGEGDASQRPGGTSCEWNMTGVDGVPRVMAVDVQPMLGTAGEVRGYWAQGVDVTEERRTSSLLAQALHSEQEAARRQAELDRLRNDFVTTASHELRTPLTSILGYVELLETGIDDAERRGRFATAIRRNVARLQQLAESLVTLSDSSSVHPHSADPLDLRDVVAAVRATTLDLDAGQGQPTVVPEFSWPEQPTLVRGEASQLELLVHQLVDNAVKFTPPGGRVCCRVAQSEEEATIEVSDTGPGVPQSEVPHLFTPFFRGAAVHEAAVPGPGLGLSIVAAVVTEHGGRILVSENDPQGAVFTVRLPLAP